MTATQPTGSPGQMGRVRAGDDDRARATSRLSEHYAQGRLDDTELDERTSRALTAVYTDELSALFVDLPGTPVTAAVPRPSRSMPTTAPRVPPRRSWVPVLLVAAVLLVVLTRGAALWLLFAMWWFVGPASRGHRRARRHAPGWDGRGWEIRGWESRGWESRGWDGGSTPGPLGPRSTRPLGVGATSSCRR